MPGQQYSHEVDAELADGLKAELGGPHGGAQLSACHAEAGLQAMPEVFE